MGPFVQRVIPSRSGDKFASGDRLAERTIPQVHGPKIGSQQKTGGGIRPQPPIRR